MKTIKVMAIVLSLFMTVFASSCVFFKTVETSDVTAKIESVEVHTTVGETAMPETVANTTAEIAEATVSAAPAEIPIPKEYTEILEMYKTGIENKWTPEQYDSVGISYLVANLELSDIGYAVFDLDENGVDELIVNGGDDSALNVFTIADGKLVSLLSGAERNRYFLCEEGYIISEGSYNAAAGEDVVHLLKGDEVVPLQYFVYEYAEEAEEAQFYFSTKTDEVEKMSPISAESAYEMLGGYMPLELTFETLE
ncbi:MAG: hypothetical protein IJA60_05370 [Clostridia bacterium]|nr:hypothetical protein [Clostridia bacterium]